MIRITRQLDPYEFLAFTRGADTLEAGAMWEKAERLHNCFFTVTLDLPHRPRTTGPKSQSAHLHGHLSQLAIHFGYTKLEMKEIMKDDVPEWPMEKRRIGKRVKLRPVSEADVSMEVESKAIEWCHLIGTEEGVTLKEE